MDRQCFFQSFLQTVRRAGIDPLQLPEDLLQFGLGLGVIRHRTGVPDPRVVSVRRGIRSMVRSELGNEVLLRFRDGLPKNSRYRTKIASLSMTEQFFSQRVTGRSSLADLGFAQLENPFCTDRYVMAMQQLGYECWVIGIRTNGILQEATIAVVRHGRMSATFEIASLPAAAQRTMVSDGAYAQSKQLKVTDLIAGTFASARFEITLFAAKYQEIIATISCWRSTMAISPRAVGPGEFEHAAAKASGCSPFEAFGKRRPGPSRLHPSSNICRSLLSGLRLHGM